MLCSQDLPDANTVSSSLQQMWALTEVMQSQQTSASVGRFDVSLTPFSAENHFLRPEVLKFRHASSRLCSQVDGCYHLDFLSLTSP